MKSIAIIFLIILIINGSNSSNSMSKQSRQKRFAPYSPYQTGIAIGVGISCPVDNGRGDIFVSVCIQSNYNQPTYPPLNPSPFQTIYGDTVDRKFNDVDFDESVTDEETNKADNSNDSGKSNRGTFKRLLDTMTRKKFFELFKHKLKTYGFNGKSCLLKAICEVSQNVYSQYNGVLGDIVHILFTTPTSKDEQLPLAYYKAQHHGTSGKCSEIYDKKCSISIFDYMSFT